MTNDPLCQMSWLGSMAPRHHKTRAAGVCVSLRAPWQPVSITRNLRGARRFVKWIREECKAGSAKRGQCANGLGWRAVAVRDAITQILLAHLVRPTMTED